MIQHDLEVDVRRTGATHNFTVRVPGGTDQLGKVMEICNKHFGDGGNAAPQSSTTKEST